MNDFEASKDKMIDYIRKLININKAQAITFVEDFSMMFQKLRDKEKTNMELKQILTIKQRTQLDEDCTIEYNSLMKEIIRKYGR